MSQFRQLLSPLLRRFRTSSKEDKNDSEAEATSSLQDLESKEPAVVVQNKNNDDPRRRQVVDLASENPNAKESNRTKRTLKRANTEASPICGSSRENRESSMMTKSATNKDFLSKDEARRRMMSWRKTTSLRYSSNSNKNSYYSIDSKK